MREIAEEFVIYIKKVIASKVVDFVGCNLYIDDLPISLTEDENSKGVYLSDTEDNLFFLQKYLPLFLSSVLESKQEFGEDFYFKTEIQGDRDLIDHCACVFLIESVRKIAEQAVYDCKEEFSEIFTERMEFTEEACDIFLKTLSEGDYYLQ